MKPMVRSSDAIMKLANTAAGFASVPSARISTQIVAASSTTIISCRTVAGPARRDPGPRCGSACCSNVDGTADARHVEQAVCPRARIAARDRQNGDCEQGSDDHEQRRRGHDQHAGLAIADQYRERDREAQNVSGEVRRQTSTAMVAMTEGRGSPRASSAWVTTTRCRSCPAMAAPGPRTAWPGSDRQAMPNGRQAPARMQHDSPDFGLGNVGRRLQADGPEQPPGAYVLEQARRMRAPPTRGARPIPPRPAQRRPAPRETSVRCFGPSSQRLGRTCPNATTGCAVPVFTARPWQRGKP